MKKFKKYISLIMSVLIIFSFFFQSSLIVYATDTSHGGGGGNREEGANNGNDDNTERDWSKILDEFIKDVGENAAFLAAQVGSLYNGDFVQYLENNDAYINYWNSDNISVDNDGNFTFSEDLVSAFKQALTEYEQETNGYYILSTPSVMELDPTLFNNRNRYISLVNMINKYGIVLACVQQDSYGPNNLWIGDASYLVNGTYSLALQNTSVNPVENQASGFFLNFYDSAWKKYSYYNVARISFTGDDNKIFTEIPEGEEYNYNLTSSVKPHYSREIVYAGSLNNLRKIPNGSLGSYGGLGSLVSKDGCRIRVFKSENAMKLYDSGKRAVYFTPDFYDKEPQEIVVKFDDLEKYLNTDYDKYFKEIHDAIMEQGGNLSEDVIEKMTADILGKLDYGNSLTEEGNQISSYWLERIYKELVAIDEMMAAKLDSIIEYLKKIRNWTVADTIIDGVDAVADVVSLITGILEDVDEGVGSAVSTLLGALDEGASMLSQKFPFSIPWDLLFFVTLLAHEPEVPYFEVPIDFTISALGIDVHYDFVIDFSSFQYLSDISRTILSMTYCVGLFKFTSNAVAAKKED